MTFVYKPKSLLQLTLFQNYHTARMRAVNEFYDSLPNKHFMFEKIASGEEDVINVVRDIVLLDEADF